MPSLEERFNQSGFSRFINGSAGRILRLAAGMTFILAGYAFRRHALGIASMVWGIFPLTAGAFDVCYISIILGGPFSGKKIREKQKPH